jgi:hypothetical protein
MTFICRIQYLGIHESFIFISFIQQRQKVWCVAIVGDCGELARTPYTSTNLSQSFAPASRLSSCPTSANGSLSNCHKCLNCRRLQCAGAAVTARTLPSAPLAAAVLSGELSFSGRPYHRQCYVVYQLRPYTPESTGSRLISEVKLVMAQSVLWWGTTREYCVL